jgi:cytochrome c-type biogenesis protein CcmH
VSRGVLPDELNVQVIKDQLAELKADLAAGRLDQSAFAAAQRDLERELLDDVPSRPADAVGNIRRGRWLALVLVLLVPALAVPVYQRIGAQALIERLADGAATTTPGAQQTLEAMVEGLAARMQQEPDNAEGWALLGRSYAALNRAADAVAAYRQALRLTPDDPQVLSDFADVLVVAHNGEFTDEVGQLLDRALAADPHFPKALWLRGHWKYRQARSVPGRGRADGAGHRREGADRSGHQRLDPGPCRADPGARCPRGARRYRVYLCPRGGGAADAAGHCA